MTSEIAKTIATSAIWISTSIILACGLFRMNGNANEEVLVVITFMVMSGATLSTIVIWLIGNRKSKPSPPGFEVVPTAAVFER